MYGAHDKLEGKIMKRGPTGCQRKGNTATRFLC